MAGAPDQDELLALRAALVRLAPRQRAVLVLRYYEGRTERETADLLGIAPGTVKSQARAALTRLRSLLGGEGAELVDRSLVPRR
jgi:RNA polymerase sigma factor (sigma-70 family)